MDTKAFMPLRHEKTLSHFDCPKDIQKTDVLFSFTNEVAAFLG